MTPETVKPLWIAAPQCGREACFSLPAVRAIAAVRPVEVICHFAHRDFWEAASVGRIHVVQEGTKKESAAILREASEILLWEGGLFADAAAKAGVGVRTGLPAPDLAKRLTTPITRAINPGPVEHAVRRYLAVAGHFGADPFDPEFFTPLDHPIEKSEGYLLIPTSSFGSHYDWPLERWVEVIAQLGIEKESVQVLAEDPGLEIWASEQGLPVIPKADLWKQLAAASKVISVESPWPHFAAAFGATCAILYGPGDPNLHRPLGKQHLAIRKKAECAPCFTHKCPMDLRCQKELSVERVVAELQPLTRP